MRFSLDLKDEEAHDLAKVMMSRKASRLYGRMQRGIAQKKADVEVLHQRRKELDRAKEKGGKSDKKANTEDGGSKKSKKNKRKRN